MLLKFSMAISIVQEIFGKRAFMCVLFFFPALRG